MGSFLQSKNWANFQKTLGRKVFEIGGTHLIKYNLPFEKSYLYVPAGPQFPISNFQFPKLKELAKQENAIFVKADPMEDMVAKSLVEQGFKRSLKLMNPHKTVIIDLTQSEEQLLSKLHHKTRYNIRHAERKGITVEKANDPDDQFPTFWQLMEKTTERDDFSAHSKSYYETLINFFSVNPEIKTQLWFAYIKDKPGAAATITLTYKDTVYYLFSASDHEFRSYKAPNLLRWQIMLQMKREGFAFADFWGIDAKRWPGITAYKLGWGGRVVEYPGAFDLVISPLWYAGYKIARRFKKI
mgnify:CR=1 FL=1